MNKHLMIKKNYITVFNKSQFSDMLSYIDTYGELAFDTETTGLNARQDTVIGFSITGKAGTGYYYPLYRWDVDNEELVEANNNPVDNAKLLLNKIAEKNLIMHNGSFDCRVTKNSLGVDLLDSLVADTVLMKHTVDENPPFGLKEIAKLIQDKIGLDIDKEANEEQIELLGSIKANGGSTAKSNYELYKADVEIIGKYGAADTDLTFRVFEYYYDKLEREGLLEFFFDLETMPFYKSCIIPMEDRGVAVDLELLHSLLEKASDLQDKIEQELMEEFRSMPEFQDWFKKHLNDKVAPTKGGQFGQAVAELAGFSDLPRTKSGKYSLTKKNIESYCRPCMASGFLLGNSELDEEFKLKCQALVFMSKNGCEINLGSTQQMGDLVFNFFNIPPLGFTDTGNGQFNEEVIDHLSDSGLSWAKKIHNYNKLKKLKGTYLQGILNKTEDGIFYPYFKQHGTVSGRLSSDIQQLPRPLEGPDLDKAYPEVAEIIKLIRKLFIARPGHKMIICDQSSLEARVFASVSEDSNLIGAFLDGEDLYSKIAIQAFGLTGMSAKKSDENYVKKVAPEYRQRAKAIALAIPYGSRAFQVSKTLDISKDEAQDLIDSYLAAYPSLKNWMEFSDKFVQTNGYITTKVGRVRHLPRVKEIYSRYSDNLMSFKYRKGLEKKIGKEEVKNLYLDYKNGINNGRNSQIQGLSASIMNRSGVAIMERFRRQNLKAFMLFTVHDEYIFEVVEEDLDTACKIVQDCMENTLPIAASLEAIPNVADDFAEGHD